MTQANGPRGGPTGAVRACAVELSDGVYQGGIEAQIEERRIETTALLWFASSIEARCDGEQLPAVVVVAPTM